jgi:CRP-like cAMP-binding protein
MSQDKSCIIKNFSSYREISPDDEALLSSLEHSPKAVHDTQSLWREGDPSEHFYVLKAGWACSYRDLPDGRRQILDLFLPGDIVGTRDYAFEEHLTGASMLTAGIVCPFPVSRLCEVFERSITLTDIFFIVASREQAMLVERLIDLGRRSARQKLAHFIAEMYVRVQRRERFEQGRLRLPVSQQVLADVLGLSAVHISRTFSDLQDDGVLYRQREYIHIPDFSRLAAEGDFADRYL